MALRDLLRSPGSSSDTDVPLRSRLYDALEPPPMPNRYVAPYLRTIDAIAFAFRGYDVMWTKPAGPCVVAGKGPMRVLPSEPSVLVYVTRSGSRVELPTIIPGELHRAASWLESVRKIGWKFAAWQVRRELSWILQRRRRR